MTRIQSARSLIALATLAATAFLSQALHAQVHTYASRVNVPFGFDCGSQHFAAGVYTVKMIDSNMLVVSNQTESASVMTLSDTQSESSAGGYLTFRKYGNRYFLGEYHPANSVASAAISQSKSERSVARDFAANKTDQGRVRLALLESDRAIPSGR